MVYYTNVIFVVIDHRMANGKDGVFCRHFRTVLGGNDHLVEPGEGLDAVDLFGKHMFALVG